MEIQRFNEDINGFSESVKNYYNYVIVKNQEYLNWRYCENRGGSYVIYLARDNEKILGFIVLRINVFKDDYPRGYIVDMLALPKRLDVMNALVNDSVLFFNNKKVNIISCQIVRSHPYEKILKKHGFVYSQQNKSLFYTVYAHFDDELKRVEESLGEKISFPFGDRDDI
jgi:hypothetical protein